jgi:tRNA(Ile)-lysidine synthase TilS/MesJ
VSVVVFHDRTGGAHTLAASPGQPLSDVLRENGIPANAMLAYRRGAVVSEDVATVQPDDLIEIRQVRHYDLDVTRNPRVRTYGAPNVVYTKKVLFDQNGALEQRAEQFDAATFIRYVEQTFVQSVQLGETIRPGERAVIGLSGGRDSVAYLKLLERTRGQYPEAPMTAVTIAGLPDWDEPATFSIAASICAECGIEQSIVHAADIAEVFRLRRPYAEIMSEVVAGRTRHMNMVIGHQVLRRMLEREAERRSAAVVTWGFNADDLVASLVTWFTSGFSMGGIPARTIGGRRHVFPLYRITKKELTLYLELVAPELTRQGAPGRFTTGNDERSMAYAIADHLYDLWPGIDYYLFAAFENNQRSTLPAVEDTCDTCGGVFLPQEGIANPRGRCDVCAFFRMQEYVAAD